MRHAAVVLEVFDRPDEGHDEVEVGSGAGEKSRRDAPRQRARPCVLRRRGAGEQRSGERVGQGVHDRIVAFLSIRRRPANPP